MLAPVVLVLLVLAAGVSDRTGRAGALVLAALAVVWTLVNNPMEGPLLLFLTREHGVTGADLTSLAAFAIAAYRFLTTPRRA
jgi:hypothetical protein